MKMHDPFLGKDVQVSDRLTDRLRGRYATGPTLPNGEPEFGWREFPTNAIQREAATELDRLQNINAGLFKALKDMVEFWAYGMNKPKGAKPTAVDDARIEMVAAQALDALHAADSNYIKTLPWSGKP